MEEHLRGANGPVWVIHGIGTSFTESSAFVLAHLDPAKRQRRLVLEFADITANAWISAGEAMLNDQILEAFPAGTMPPVEEITLRSEAEMEPYLREPLSKGWKSVYGLPRIGQGSDL